MRLKNTLACAVGLILITCQAFDRMAFTAYSWPPALVKKAVASTSVVFVQYSDGEAMGSGVLLSKDGLTLTAAHVVLPDDYEKVYMRTSEGNEYDIRILAVNARADLALVEPIASVQNFTYSKLQESDKLYVGQDVLIVGHPFHEYWTVTSGIISRLPWSWKYLAKTMETDAVVNPGNSGGPVFNTRGEIIGIVSAMRVDMFGPTGIGIAIPIGEIHRFFRMYEYKKRAPGRKRYRLGDVK